MSRRFLFVVIAAAALALTACEDTLTNPDDEPELPEYAGAGTPADALHDLEVAWIRRDLETYRTLLADEFTFHPLRDALGQERPLETWNRDQEVAATANLFLPGRVDAIRVDLTTLPPTPTTLTEFPGEEFQRIVVLDTFLDVVRGEDTFRVSGDRQYFWFREGDPERGEDPDRRLLVRWQDLGRIERGPAPEGAPTPVHSYSWTSLKVLFADAVS